MVYILFTKACINWLSSEIVCWIGMYGQQKREGNNNNNTL